LLETELWHIHFNPFGLETKPKSIGS